MRYQQVSIQREFADAAFREFQIPSKAAAVDGSNGLICGERAQIRDVGVGNRAAASLERSDRLVETRASVVQVENTAFDNQRRGDGKGACGTEVDRAGRAERQRRRSGVIVRRAEHDEPSD